MTDWMTAAESEGEGGEGEREREREREAKVSSVRRQSKVAHSHFSKKETDIKWKSGVFSILLLHRPNFFLSLFGFFFFVFFIWSACDIIEKKGGWEVERGGGRGELESLFLLLLIPIAEGFALFSDGRLRHTSVCPIVSVSSLFRDTGFLGRCCSLGSKGPVSIALHWFPDYITY